MTILQFEDVGKILHVTEENLFMWKLYISQPECVCSEPEDNQGFTLRGKHISSKRVAINIDLIYPKMYTCGIRKGI